VFDRTQYVIEKKLVTFRDAYGVKDVNGNLLGYIKRNSKFWFEGMDGTRQGEIREVGGTYEVYDAQNQLRATVVWTGGLGFRSSKWQIKDPQGQQLAIAEGDFLGRNYRILAPDGSTIAQIHKKWTSIWRNYRIDISRQGLDPFLILSYVVVDISEQVMVPVPFV
jgi:uncharacterized protein YxjI